MQLTESAGSYEREIREAARGLWSGMISYEQFFDSMLSTIRGGLTQAWSDGMKECNMTPADMTSDERTTLEYRIVEESSHLSGFASFIEAGSKANGGLLRDVFSRVELWVYRYQDLVNQAKLTVCKDPKLKWKWNPMKEHCSTCRRLNGRVYRASIWNKNGVQPQSPPNSSLECGGWKCGCELEITSDRVTPGPFPAVP